MGNVYFGDVMVNSLIRFMYVLPQYSFHCTLEAPLNLPLLWYMKTLFIGITFSWVPYTDENTSKNNNKLA